MIPMAMPLIKSRPPLVVHVQLAATPGQCSGRARTHPRFPGLRVFVGGGRSHEGHGGSTAARAAPQREQSSGASRHPSRWHQSWHRLSWAASSIPSSPDQAGVVSSSKLDRSSADIKIQDAFSPVAHSSRALPTGGSRESARWVHCGTTARCCQLRCEPRLLEWPRLAAGWPRAAGAPRPCPRAAARCE